MNRGLHLAVVGATGAVGQEFLTLLAERRFPIASLRLLASARSVGTQIPFRGDLLTVQEAKPDSFESVDLALFSAGASRSRALAPAAIAAGARVVDNSSAFRMESGVPLVVPEVNPEDLRPEARLLAVANCTAILLVTAIHPLRQLGRLKRVIVSTYQSASGGGAAMMRLLESETRAVLAGESPAPSELQTRYAFNLFSHNTAIGEDGHNEEEAKVMQETRKILGDPELRMNVTCVRVPVLRAHSESVTLEFDGPAPTVEAARAALTAAPGVRLMDERGTNQFPTPFDASGQDDVLVGRLRQDPSNPNGLCLFLSGDQLRKGAALNAIQVAELAFGIRPTTEALS